MELTVSNQVPLKKGICPGLIKYTPKKWLGFSWQKNKKDLKCEKDLIWGDSLAGFDDGGDHRAMNIISPQDLRAVPGWQQES